MSGDKPFSIVGAFPHNEKEKKSEMAIPTSVAFDRYSLLLKFLLRPISKRKKAVNNSVNSGVRAVQSISS